MEVDPDAAAVRGEDSGEQIGDGAGSGGGRAGCDQRTSDRGYRPLTTLCGPPRLAAFWKVNYLYGVLHRLHNGCGPRVAMIMNAA